MVNTSTQNATTIDSSLAKLRQVYQLFRRIRRENHAVTGRTGGQGNDLWAQWESARGTAVLPKATLRPITADVLEQPCSEFGLHPSVPNLQARYTDGDEEYGVPPALVRPMPTRRRGGAADTPSTCTSGPLATPGASRPAKRPARAGLLREACRGAPREVPAPALRALPVEGLTSARCLARASEPALGAEGAAAACCLHAASSSSTPPPRKVPEMCSGMASVSSATAGRSRTYT